jgi:hypothetical protein
MPRCVAAGASLGRFGASVDGILEHPEVVRSASMSLLPEELHYFHRSDNRFCLCCTMGTIGSHHASGRTHFQDGHASDVAVAFTTHVCYNYMSNRIWTGLKTSCSHSTDSRRSIAGWSAGNAAHETTPKDARLYRGEETALKALKCRSGRSFRVSGCEGSWMLEIMDVHLTLPSVKR